ncbi:MAG TPA: hypothetical protein VN622_06435 [Clostridia bacterium]|nr:hypothetical protein [Clostridia bacterium]
MTRIAKSGICTILFGTLVLAAGAQSLGDVARRQKEQQPKAKASKVYTNDEIPSTTVPNDVSRSDAGKDATASREAKSAKADSGNSKDADTPEEKKKREQEWKDKVSDAKKGIADLERELALMDREYKLRAAVFYADAGARLRDDKKWADEDRKYKEGLAKNQTALSAAKQKLEDLREQARKAGVSMD